MVLSKQNAQIPHIIHFKSVLATFLPNTVAQIISILPEIFQKVPKLGSHTPMSTMSNSIF